MNRLLVLAVIVPLAVACSSGRAHPTPQPTPGTSVTVPSRTTTVNVGTSVITPAGNRVTVRRWVLPADYRASPSPGRIFGRLDVRVCVSRLHRPVEYPVAFKKSWMLETKDGAVVPPVDVPGDLSKRIESGTCAERPIFFEPARGASPRYAVLSASGVIRWTIG